MNKSSSKIAYCYSADNVQRWERAVQDDEDELERCKEAEQKQMAKIEQDMKDVDSLRKERLAKKAEVDAVDEEVNKVWFCFSCKAEM